jgi:fermentation-respiration switch protein FrsA (DUF1100 family)
MQSDADKPAIPGQPRTWQRRIARAIILYAVTPYLMVIAIFTVFQRQLMYRPTVASSLSVAAVGRPADFAIDVELTSADNTRLRGWLVHSADRQPDDGGQSSLVLYFPGNSLNRLDRIQDLCEVASRGFDVLVFDYRGFGDSEGSPSESRLSADSLLIWKYACEDLGYDESRIIIFGESLGGAVALSLWSEANSRPPQPAALILSSTFASMQQTVAWHYPFFPFQWLLLDRWPSSDRIGRVQSPIIVFHGTADDMIPIEQGQKLAQASSRSEFISIPGGGHNEVPVSLLCAKLELLHAALSTSAAGLKTKSLSGTP